MKSSTLAGSLLCAIALATGIPVGAQDGTVTLTRTFKAGETYRYKTTISASVMGADIVVTQIAKDETKEITKEGHAVIITTTESATMNIGGVDQEGPPSPPITMTRSKLNRLVEYKGSDNPAAFFTPEIEKLMATVGETMLGEKAVKAGDTWQVEVDNPAVKGKKVALKGTFIGMDKVEGKDLWKVKQTAEAATDMDAGKMSYDILVWLDPKNGSLVKAEGSVKDIPSTQAGVISFTLKMEALKSEASK